VTFFIGAIFLAGARIDSEPDGSDENVCLQIRRQPAGGDVRGLPGKSSEVRQQLIETSPD
jgi:hypothetical protein